MSNSLIFAVQMKKLNGGYLAEVPSLPGCHTFGETYEEALSHAQEAVQGFVEARLKLGLSLPDQPRRSQLYLSITLSSRRSTVGA